MSRKPKESYLKDEVLERLARQNVELLSELWITRDRLASLEILLEQKGVTSRGDIEEFVPDENDAEYINRLRTEMVEKVMDNRPAEATVEQLRRRGQTSAARFLWEQGSSE